MSETISASRRKWQSTCARFPCGRAPRIETVQGAGSALWQRYEWSGAGMRWNVENNEMELVHQACRGDREAYWRLVQPHLRAVLSIARTILTNLAEAEEVAQEAVLRALSDIQGFRGQVKFSTWLIQITINEARNKLRQDPKQELSQESDNRQTHNVNPAVPKDFTEGREITSP